MSTPLVGHHQLRNRYYFTGEFEAVTPLRISSGRAGDDTDAPFIRTFDGTPYIPGSSLRGAIRSEVERILAAIGVEATGLETCSLFAADSCAERLRRQLQNSTPTDEQIRAAAEGMLCDVCRLFGNTFYASRLIVEDSLPSVETLAGTKSRCTIRDGVGIDRDTGAARDGAKFDFEVIDPKGKVPLFRFRMIAENLGKKDKKLIDIILQILRSGLHVGGKRAGGLGMLRMAQPPTVTGFEDPKALWEMILRKKSAEENTVVWEEDLC